MRWVGGIGSVNVDISNDYVGENFGKCNCGRYMVGVNICCEEGNNLDC